MRVAPSDPLAKQTFGADAMMRRNCFYELNWRQRLTFRLISSTDVPTTTTLNERVSKEVWTDGTQEITFEIDPSPLERKNVFYVLPF
ncbi:hypothetical protein RB195_013102 [Necator americanus]|uniref:Uncharacterized protein n=1 Tax=Necator americanus TaxID=51031 RepID=A0ABR1DU04_NECAM